LYQLYNILYDTGMALQVAQGRFVCHLLPLATLTKFKNQPANRTSLRHARSEVPLTLKIGKE